ncbi:hypothetical protein GCN78_24595 [Janthinobacterium rivuli]|nr:hypothetical protein GCN78_24595 [Janthinobacterium sp. FT68W]
MQQQFFSRRRRAAPWKNAHRQSENNGKVRWRRHRILTPTVGKIQIKSLKSRNLLKSILFDV